ncbi:uncharacterized protein [Nicotiana sylvestris]|uniref:uncharacterized protein n=1 Tax=Nicotiana sylvestris TaxID=4096 RepID=UPI00388C8FB1
MADSMPHKMITRGIPTKILNFDGLSFSLQITKGESDFAGKSATTVSQRRTKLHNDKSKEVHVEKFSKERKNSVVSKMKKPMNDSSCVNVKEVAAKKKKYTTPKVSQLKENLTPDQYQQLGNTCFGSFLQMKRCEVQHQLFRCFMALQLEDTPNNVFAVHVNGTSLHFTLREFAIVTSLKCVGNDEDFEFSEKFPNRLIETYFGGSNLVKKEQLMKCFADKNWGPDNDGDALKISLLYFIHTFIFSSEKNSTTIPRLHFDLVERGRYSEYHWGLKAFEMLTKSISMKMNAEKKYYRIAGMPLAMQVWFYECCSVVDSKIALRVDDVVPRILNWRTTGYQPTFAYLMNGMFNDTENMDISPSDIELAIIQNPPVGADVEKRPSPAHSDKSGEDSDDFSPSPKLQCKKKHVASIGPYSSLPHKKRKEHERHPNETEYQPKIPPVCQTESLHQRKEPIGRRDDGIDTDVGDNVKKQVLNDQCLEYRGEGKTTSEVPSNIPSTGQEGVSTEFYVSQFELDDKFLPSQILETRIVIHNNAKKAESTPIPSHGNRRPSRCCSQMYSTAFVFRFIQLLYSDVFNYIQLNSNVLFSYSQLYSTAFLYVHIDVIFYYLRKKGKYNQTSNFKYTTVDCIFKTRITEIFNMYADTDSNANVAKEEDVVCEYIRGYKLHANVPWHTVDNVMIPVNLKDKLHWVLAVVSFKERCTKVYDSYRSAGHDAYVVSEIYKIAKLVPLYLSISGFYRDSQGIDWSTYSAYTDKSHNDPFEVFFISDLPQQKAGSIDCGVHVAAYAEFLSTLGEIPQITFDSSLLRQRYGDLLWDYAMRKIDVDAISENESPSKIARQITESDSNMQIVLE